MKGVFLRGRGGLILCASSGSENHSSDVGDSYLNRAVR